MVVEGGSKDGLSDNEDDLAGFDDSPLLYPELVYMRLSTIAYEQAHLLFG